MTEPRYPCADESLGTIILTQTIYLCQLILHLQEFDPCMGVISDDTAVDDELLRVFQDSVAREYNVAYDTRVRDGPAPEGDPLERVVRGLMRAELEGSQSAVPTAPTAPLPSSSPVEQTRVRLQQLLAQVLKELNAPLVRRTTRYEERYGPRTDATWAARFATRVMQWRHAVRNGSGSLGREVIAVQKHDIFPMDEEGMQVYQILRNAAPGRIHLATPVQPDIPQQQQSRPSDHGAPQGQVPHAQHQHNHSVSSGMKVQHMLAPPLAKTPDSTPSESSDTPRTTPQYPHPPRRAGSYAESSAKRESQDLGHPPAKRLQLTTESGARGDGAEAGSSAAAGGNPIRGGPMDVDDPHPDATAAVSDANALVLRILDRVTELGQKIDSMQQGMDERIEQLDERLQRIQESLV